MKRIICILLMILSTEIYSQIACEGIKVIPVETFNQCNSNPWVLVFEENFDGSRLDLSKWTYGPRIRYCNPEQQYYNHGDNIEISNGTLKLIAKVDTIYERAVDWEPDNAQLYCEDGRNRGKNKRYFYYSSGDIETIDKFSYGKFEARIKIPKGKGFWPAFWLYGGDPVYNEIDIFEFWNENNLFGKYDASKLCKVHHMNIHYHYYDNRGRPMCQTKYTGIDFSQDFHVFTLIWEEDKVEWYVDGILRRTDYKYYTLLGKPAGCMIYAYQYYILNTIFPRDPMSIIFNLAIQNGQNSPDNSTIFPNQMEIDWVRYYARSNVQEIK